MEDDDAGADDEEGEGDGEDCGDGGFESLVEDDGADEGEEGKEDVVGWGDYSRSQNNKLNNETGYAPIAVLKIASATLRKYISVTK